jgi:predicted aspartyl protease
VAYVSGAARPGQAPVGEDVVLFVDSGSSHSALPRATFDRLVLARTVSHFATIEDAAGTRHRWEGALVPGIRLGDVLMLGDVVATVADRQPILGADVLTAHGWQIDLDRGVLRLGGPTLPSAPGGTTVATHRWKMHAIVDVAIEGVPVPMLLDTGAPITVVDRSAATRLHRPERRLQFPMPPTPDARISLATAVDAAITLGDISLGARAIPVHPQERIGPAGAHGILGTDILFEYAFQADGDALRLTPRSPSLVDSVKARLSRWRDLPDCPDLPGCVRADITPIEGPTGRTVRVHLHLQRSWSRPTRYLFGCAGAQPAGVQPL